MPRIPVYNSRVSAPGPIPGPGNDLAAPGRALARLGGAIGGFGEALARRAARDKAAGRVRRAKGEAAQSDQQDRSGGDQSVGDPEAQDDLTRQARDDAMAVLDQANDDARFSVMRADALWQASQDSDPGQLVERALSYFDAASRALIEEAGDPALRARRQVLAKQNRDVLAKRADQRRNGHTPAILNDRLAAALGGYANAVRRDPAMLAAMLQKGADTIAESVRFSGLGRERTEAMTEGWVRQVHVALVEGTIARDPALALASLKSGELDGPLGNDVALTGRLTRQAERALTVAEAEERRRVRAQRQLFELQKAEHLESIRKTGRGDAETVTLAGGLLDPQEMAAFRAEIEDAEAHHAAREAYAFLPEKEIAKDLKRPATGGAAAGKGVRATRKTARDEILAERRKDPAGWAMRDETVAEAFAAAEEATAAAASPESGFAEADQADRAFQRALALRTQTQADMGAEPRLLTEAEHEALAEELQSLAPAGRLARIGALRRRYGDDYNGLPEELSSRVAPDTAILLARADDPALARALARGMALDGVAVTGARELTLPMIGGRVDSSRLEDKQLYTFMAGDRIARVVYDRKADALVPALRESAKGEPDSTPAQSNLPDPSRPESTAGETAQMFVENVPAMFKRSIGGMIQAVGEANPSVDPALVPGGTAGIVFPAYQDPAMQEIADLIREAQAAPNGLGDFGREMFARATLDLQQNAPNVDPESFKGYAYEISNALVQMAPAVGASVATGSPAIGLTVLGAQVYGDRYGESRAAGRTEGEAHMDATFYALTEAIPERIPLGILMKQGMKFLPRLTQTMAAEGVQEMFTEVLQSGYDAGILDEEMTWGEAWDRIKRSGIIGSFAAGGTSVAAHPFVAGAPRPDLDTSVAGTEIDWDLVSGYAESSRHKRFTDTSPSTAEPGSEGREVFGNVDPNSKKRIVQPVNDAEQMQAMAQQNVEPLSRQLGELVADLPSVEFVGARAKESSRMADKLRDDRRPDTLGDYLGGRIVFEDKAMLNEIVRVLARRYKNIEFDNFMRIPRESGYRAIHIQIVLDNGMTAEIQIMPRKIYEVYLEEHKESYTPGRGSDGHPSRKDALMALKKKEEYRARYEKTWKQFLGDVDNGPSE